MTDTIIGDAVAGAVQDVLETMFFTPVEGPAEEPAQDALEGFIDARLRFEGEQHGCFCLRLSEGAARSIAANFVGAESEDELTDAAVGDAVAELTNMVCGAALSRVAPEAHFALSHPGVKPSQPWGTHETDGSRNSFDVGNGTLTACMAFSHSCHNEQ